MDAIPWLASLLFALCAGCICGAWAMLTMTRDRYLKGTHAEFKAFLFGRDR